MNKIGREKSNRIEFEESGFISCDGIVIDNVKNLLIDYCDDEIILQDKNSYEVGRIHLIKQRKLCMFCDYKEFKDIAIIINGKAVI